jgi:ribonuclease E
MFNPTVQLKSGGYIVIGVTEALVAIDVNSGRATKEGSIEETALKTNLEAADEVARQLRLRDLAGLIVIDFIDMDERRNNAAVEKRMKERLKTDRARIQVGRISGFGLMEMSRQRLRPGMIEATTQPCPACHGTGLIRSDDNLALSILRQVEEEGVRRRSREVLLKCPVGIANYLMNQKREHVAQIEARYGLSVRIEGDPVLVSPDFTLEKFKTATRTVPEPDAAQFVSAGAALMVEIDETEDDVNADEGETKPEANGEEGDKPKKKRRRSRSRGRRKSKTGGEGQQENGQSGNGPHDNSQSDETGDKSQDAPAEVNEEAAAQPAEAESVQAEAEAPKPKPKTSSRSRKKTPAKADGDEAPADAEVTAEAKPEDVAQDKPKPRSRSISRKKKEPEATPVVEKATAAAEPTPEPEPAPAAEVQPQPEPASQPEPTPEPVAEEPAKAPEPEPETETVTEDAAPAKPKRRGWWSLG